MRSGKPSIAVWYNLPSGGGKRQVWYHVRGLVERGYKVTAFRPPVPQGSYLSISDLVEEIEIPLTYPTISNRRLLLKIPEMYHFPERRQEAMEKHCREFAERASNFDLVFANTCMHFAAPVVGRYVKQPSLVYLGEPCRPLYEAQPKLLFALPEPDGKPKSLKAKLGDPLVDFITNHEYRYRAREENKNAAAFDRILVNSLFSRESTIRTYGLDSHVCYLGVDTEIFRWQNLEREHFVVGLGSFDYVKNVGLAIRALAAMRERKFKLVWICNFANPNYRREMLQLAEEEGVDLDIREMVTDDDLVNTLNRATAMLYTSRLEPFGFAPIEAGACGAAVIGIPEGGIRETVLHGQNGLLGVTSEELGRQLDDLALHPKRAFEMGQVGLQRVRELWTLDKCNDRLESHVQAMS